MIIFLILLHWLIYYNWKALIQKMKLDISNKIEDIVISSELNFAGDLIEITIPINIEFFTSDYFCIESIKIDPDYNVKLGENPNSKTKKRNNKSIKS